MRHHAEPEISHGLHAVALDEYRADFSPTLWDADKG
ncbi:phospholipase effector Tle1 domain-containing protein [Geoanaerobacter pelophilus]